VRAGQFKVPFDHIRYTSDMARQLVDYSLTTGEFSQDRDIGVDIVPVRADWSLGEGAKANEGQVKSALLITVTHTRLLTSWWTMILS